MDDPEVGKRLVEEIRATLGDLTVDTAIIFASEAFIPALEAIVAQIQESLQPLSMIGATGETLVHGQTEYEGQQALTLMAVHLPQGKVRSFHLSAEDIQEFTTPSDFHDYLNVALDVRPNFVLIGEPYSLGEETLHVLDKLESAYPQCPALGGMASLVEAAGQNRLIFDGQVLGGGLVGVAFWGGVQIETIVSQGCRPIGQHMVITQAEHNVIKKLGGRSPWEALTEMLPECSPRDVELARTRGLLIGRVINEYQDIFGYGDFLIRNPLGFDRESGALAINDLVRVGQTVQFHVRDGVTANEELIDLLDQHAQRDSAGALLFTCNGRGTRLFSQRNHDARAIGERHDGLPVIGFFCAGEIGPVGQRNFLHGHTACIGFIKPAAEDVARSTPDVSDE
jgi:small ligand-binding sensory domain FIST